MCRPTDKLKLCTCATPLTELTDYWVLYRYDRKKDNFIVGLPTMPKGFSIEDVILLEKLLNDGNVFDFDLKLKTKDRLFLSFELNSSDGGGKETMEYGFEYSKGKWKQVEINMIEWQWKHNESIHGETHIFTVDYTHPPNIPPFKPL